MGYLKEVDDDIGNDHPNNQFEVVLFFGPSQFLLSKGLLGNARDGTYIRKDVFRQLDDPAQLLASGIERTHM